MVDTGRKSEKQQEAYAKFGTGLSANRGFHLGSGFRAEEIAHHSTQPSFQINTQTGRALWMYLCVRGCEPRASYKSNRIYKERAFIAEMEQKGLFRLDPIG